MKIAVLVSGRGSNLDAILKARARGSCRVEVVGVAADRDGTVALELARRHDIPTTIVAPSAYAEQAAWDRALAEQVGAWQPELVVLAGFMRIIGPALLAAFAGRIINVHPSLLPSFPGRDAPARALAKGVKLSGCTVHVVDEGVDTGPILAQAAVAVSAADTPEILHQRIQRAEHALLPAVLDAIAHGDLVLSPSPGYLPALTQVTASMFWPPVLKP